MQFSSQLRHHMFVQLNIVMTNLSTLLLQKWYLGEGSSVKSTSSNNVEENIKESLAGTYDIMKKISWLIEVSYKTWLILLNCYLSIIRMCLRNVGSFITSYYRLLYYFLHSLVITLLTKSNNKKAYKIWKFNGENNGILRG